MTSPGEHVTSTNRTAVHLNHVVDGLVERTGGTLHRHQLKAVVDECYTELAAGAKVTTFLPVLAGRMALQRLQDRGALDVQALADKPLVVIVDEHNAARSQTAAALIRFYAPGRFRVESAGVDPQPAVNQLVTDLLGEVALGLTDTPQAVTSELLSGADYLIDMRPVAQAGADTLESGVATTILRWEIEDPGATDRLQAEQALAMVDDRVRSFLRQVDPEHTLHEPVLTKPEPNSNPQP